MAFKRCCADMCVSLKSVMYCYVSFRTHSDQRPRFWGIHAAIHFIQIFEEGDVITFCVVCFNDTAISPPRTPPPPPFFCTMHLFFLPSLAALIFMSSRAACVNVPRLPTPPMIPASALSLDIGVHALRVTLVDAVAKKVYFASMDSPAKVGE